MNFQLPEFQLPEEDTNQREQEHDEKEKGDHEKIELLRIRQGLRVALASIRTRVGLIIQT